jgi:hypothetical protein
MAYFKRCSGRGQSTKTGTGRFFLPVRLVMAVPAVRTTGQWVSGPQSKLHSTGRFYPVKKRLICQSGLFCETCEKNRPGKPPNWQVTVANPGKIPAYWARIRVTLLRLGETKNGVFVSLYGRGTRYLSGITHPGSRVPGVISRAGTGVSGTGGAPAGRKGVPSRWISLTRS